MRSPRHSASFLLSSPLRVSTEWSRPDYTEPSAISQQPVAFRSSQEPLLFVAEAPVLLFVILSGDGSQAEPPRSKDPYIGMKLKSMAGRVTETDLLLTLGISDPFWRKANSPTANYQLLPLLRPLVTPHELFHAVHVDIGEVHHLAPRLDHVHAILQPEAHGAQHRQRHHGGAMHPGGTVDEQPRLGIIQRLQRKLHAAPEQLRRLAPEVVVGGVPQNFDAVGRGQAGVVPFDLHINDVGDAGLHHLHHFFVGPDATAHREAVGHPSHVHSLAAPPWSCALWPVSPQAILQADEDIQNATKRLRPAANFSRWNANQGKPTAYFTCSISCGESVL